ncbi:MAG: hypothetical protein J6P60_00765 [Lachnospiraceae bacterium]|nr:hypothetical protein [Lachnospiraceae bacterium]
MEQNTQKMSKEELKNLAASSEIALANKLTTMAFSILCTIITLAYVLEFAKGNRTLGYIIITALMALIPMIMSWVLYKGNKESVQIKRVVAIGYAVMYAFVLFTANNDLVFTYAIPMLIIVTLYNDVSYTKRIGIGVGVLNVIAIAINMISGASTEKLVTAEIQGFLIVLVVVYFVWVSTTSAKFGDIRQARLELEKHKTEELLENVLRISGGMVGAVSSVAEQMDELKASVDKTLFSMTEVSNGSNESAESVQSQMEKTGEIQSHIANVKATATNISDNVRLMTEAVSEGNQHMNRMGDLTGQIDTAGKDVAQALESFQETTAQMNVFTDMITKIATQTSMLALNASIEAARAGEAGRGFAVVATQISTLSGQTTQATNDIKELIETINKQLHIMTETIENLLRMGQEESVCADETAQNFSEISRNVGIIESHSDELGQIVINLASANDEIMSSIETISAMTQQVTAHATETYSDSEHNQQIVESINVLVQGLSVAAEHLKSYTA